jgi:hypothetical protein
MLGRDVVEGQQLVAVLGEAFDRPAVLGALFLGKDIDRPLRGPPGSVPNDLAKVHLHVGRHRERDPIQNVD